MNNNTYIYIIKNKNNQIKIGYSKNPFKRLKQLQTANSEKLELLAFFYANKVIEKRLHKMFYFDKKMGEWFNLSPAKLEYLLDYLKERTELCQDSSNFITK
jgi:hypothetical protein